MKRNTIEAARWRWRSILPQLGIDVRSLDGRHHPCPLCGGTDRWRYDTGRKDRGSGSSFCNQCGAKTGMQLAMEYLGLPFKETAARIDELLGNTVAEEPDRPLLDDTERRRMLNQLWQGGRPLEQGDPAHRYLASRTRLPAQLEDLRFHPAAPVPRSTEPLPALIARVRDQEGRPVTIHRTFLGPNGKADMLNPRAMMPGSLSGAVAIRCMPLDGPRLGIAEGLETALAASARFGVPVWSAINSALMQKWRPPDIITEVIVFGDNDRKYGGQAAAYTLAARLMGRGLRTEVALPPAAGTDWADIEAEECSA